jgi:DNA-binding LacI/PurR family transcriptional regulator
MEEFAALSGHLPSDRVKVLQRSQTVCENRPGSRIEAALERYDFRPNIYAMNQNRRLTKNIGIMVPNLADPVFAEMSRQHRGAGERRGLPVDPAELTRRQQHEVDNLDSAPVAEAGRCADGTGWAAPRTRTR